MRVLFLAYRRKVLSSLDTIVVNWFFAFGSGSPAWSIFHFLCCLSQANILYMSLGKCFINIHLVYQIKVNAAY